MTALNKNPSQDLRYQGPDLSCRKPFEVLPPRSHHLFSEVIQRKYP
jgi:hypothetical protein